MADIRSTYTDSVHFFGNENPRELAKRFGTPLYVYNEAILRQRCDDLLALSSLPGFFVNYSTKANNNPALLSIIREQGCVIDAMSPGELALVRHAGFAKADTLFVCNNVSDEELQNALAHAHLVSVDSLAQLERFGQLNPGGNVMVRFNPGIGAGHHAKVVTAGKETKFGIDPEALPHVLDILARHQLTLTGINQHIGSLFLEAQSYLDAAQVLLDLAARLLSHSPRVQLDIIDFGGGFGIPYHKYENQPRLDLAQLGHILHARLSSWSVEHRYKGRFFIEPGRYIAAECGLLLGRVYSVKQNGPTVYAGTDVGFNVLARPMLYDAFHDMEIYAASPERRQTLPQTIVGNICESGDILAKNRELPRLVEGDVLAFLDAGAYGFAMASNYNSRLRPAEILIEQSSGMARLIRRRETTDDLMTTLM